MFADDWIQTMDLWNWKRPFYQLSHNHCPSIVFFVNNSHRNGFYRDHQCSWTLTPANSMQVSNMQSDERNSK